MTSGSKEQLKFKLQELENQTVRLLDQLLPYNDDELTRQPTEGSWSVNQVLTHLILSERKSLLYVKKKLSFNPALPPSDIFSNLRSQLLRIALLLPFKYRAPKSVQINDAVGLKGFHLLRQEWLADRDDLNEYLMSLDEDLLDLQIYKHPYAGRLTPLQMVVFFTHHLRRHESQIKSRLP